LLLVVGCGPSGSASQLLHGKLIMSTGCGNYMLQVTQGTLPSDKINSTWKDPLTGIVYTNVFTVLNRCVLNDTAFHFDAEFSFRVVDTAPDSSQCNIECIWYRPSPPAGNFITDVQKLK
ncbi:MAG TPA: hypothetical protein VGM41_07190, partial [Chitinophagaceae bacterium]